MGIKAWDWMIAAEDFQRLVNEGLELNGCQQKVATDGFWLKCCKENLGLKACVTFEYFQLNACNWQDRLVAIEVLQLKGFGTEG